MKMTERVTHPYVVVLPVLLPDTARVAVEQHVAPNPVRAAVATLRSYARHLHPVPQVHLQPRVPIRQLGAPSTSSCKSQSECSIRDRGSYAPAATGICPLTPHHASTNEKTESLIS